MEIHLFQWEKHLQMVEFPASYVSLPECIHWFSSVFFVGPQSKKVLNDTKWHLQTLPNRVDFHFEENEKIVWGFLAIT